MNEKEIGIRLEEIRSNMNLFDGIIYSDFKTGRRSVSKKQEDIFCMQPYEVEKVTTQKTIDVIEYKKI